MNCFRFCDPLAVAAQIRRLLYFSGFAERLSLPQPSQADTRKQMEGSSVYDPLAASRRSALRAAVIQAVAAFVVALLFLLQGGTHAMAAGVGGGALALGHWLAACVSLSGVVSARVAFVRLLLGTGLKWVVVIGTFTTALGVWRLPPLPMVVGLVAGGLAYFLALNFRLNPSTRT